jgi:NIMA (never in mitosis gene a)-related kinase
MLSASFKSGINARYFPVLNDKDEPKTLGVGGFGAVFLCTDAKDGNRLVALKINRRSSDEEANTALEEAMKLKELKHTHIVACLSAFLVSQPVLQICTVLEYCSEGDLNAYVKKMQSGAVPSGVGIRLGMMRQLASALSYLHDTMRVLHRDIKAANVLVQPGPIIKLSDFGLAKDLSSSSHAHSYVGTPYYMSPEVKEYLPYGRASDIFSLGVLYLVLMALDDAVFNKLPAPNIPAVLVTSHQDNSNAFFAVVKSIFTTSGASSTVLDLVVRMLQRNADDRPSIDAIITDLGV